MLSPRTRLNSRTLLVTRVACKASAWAAARQDGIAGRCAWETGRVSPKMPIAALLEATVTEERNGIKGSFSTYMTKWIHSKRNIALFSTWCLTRERVEWNIVDGFHLGTVAG